MNKRLASALAQYITSMFHLFPGSVIVVIRDDEDDAQKNKRREKYERRMGRQKMTPKQPKSKQRW